MGEMRTNPVAEIEEEFLENNLIRLDTLISDVRACLKQFKDLRQQMEEENRAMQLQMTTMDKQIRTESS